MPPASPRLQPRPAYECCLQPTSAAYKCHGRPPAVFGRYGGPLVDPEELRLQFRLSFVMGLPGNLQYIEAEILKDMPNKGEWNSISTHWDPRVMGKWNVRCRVVASAWPADSNSDGPQRRAIR